MPLPLQLRRLICIAFPTDNQVPHFVFALVVGYLWAEVKACPSMCVVEVFDRWRDDLYLHGQWQVQTRRHSHLVRSEPF